jgi:4-amino-4-deoxy-L-arabinose transferase-like glycosyltransferase
VLGAAAILVLAGLVRRVAGDRAAIAAAWIAALFPPLVWMPAYALSEQLASVLALGCAAWLGTVTDGPPAARESRGAAHGARSRQPGSPPASAR